MAATKMFIGTFVAVLALVIPAAAAHGQKQAVNFAPGKTSATLNGQVKGRATQTYGLQASAGQLMHVLFSTSNASCYFNVLEPGTAEAVHNGAIQGNEFGQNPTLSGTYSIQVYLMRNAARRNETCRYQISVEVTG